MLGILTLPVRHPGIWLSEKQDRLPCWAPIRRLMVVRTRLEMPSEAALLLIPVRALRSLMPDWLPIPFTTTQYFPTMVRSPLLSTIFPPARCRETERHWNFNPPRSHPDCYSQASPRQDLLLISQMPRPFPTDILY